MLGYPVAAFLQTYLGAGAAALHRQALRGELDSLVVKAERAILGWRTGLLSQGGWLTLAEVVLMAQAIYAMSAAPLPPHHAGTPQSPRRGLFWSEAPKCGGGACLVAWELACRSKDDGGLGLKDLETLNKSLLLKHVHKLGENNTWANWVRYWYDGGLVAEETPCWGAIKALILRYHAITVVSVGDDEMTSFWHDCWAEVGVLRDALPALYSQCLDVDITVAEVVATWRQPAAPPHGCCRSGIGAGHRHHLRPRAAPTPR